MPLGSPNIKDLDRRIAVAKNEALQAEMDEQFGRAPAGTARKKLMEYDALVAEKNALINLK